MKGFLVASTASGVGKTTVTAIIRAVMAFSQSESSLIAIVTHAGVMRGVLRALCGLDEKTTWTLTKLHCCTFRYAHHSHPDRRLQEVLV
jgi:broad specificity phosphatase PhoE